MIEHHQVTELDREYLEKIIGEFLAEDGADCDKTTLGTVPESNTTVAYIEAQADIVFAGADIIDIIFSDVCKVELGAKDGDVLTDGSRIATISGPARFILSRERVMLNIIQRMSGIATIAKKYTAVASPFGVKILDTRKTLPGFRLLDKYSVRCGGGANHRYNLETGILIKDNHISAAGGIAPAIKMIKDKNYGLAIELEVDNFAQLSEGLRCGVDGVLLDNFSPEDTKNAVLIIRNSNNGKNIFIESSGGITFDTLPEYVKTGVNAISIGALTHSVKAAEIHLEFEKETK